MDCENANVRGFKCKSCNFTTLVVVLLGCELQEYIFLSTIFFHAWMYDEFQNSKLLLSSYLAGA